MVAIMDDEKHAHVGSDDYARSSLPIPVQAQMEPLALESEAEVKRIEKALVRRVDWCIIPLIMMLYLFSFLDRGKLPLQLWRIAHNKTLNDKNSN